jgi:hypothetical protein
LLSWSADFAEATHLLDSLPTPTSWPDPAARRLLAIRRRAQRKNRSAVWWLAILFALAS